MPSHIQDFVWNWGLNTLAAKHFSGNTITKFPPITPGEVVITKFIVNNVNTNVISGGSYNQWPVIHIFTDNQDGTWTVEVYNYLDGRQVRGIRERVYF